MYRSGYKLIVFFSLLFFLTIYASGYVMAQLNQTWDTVVGEPRHESAPDDTDEGESGGTDEDLPEGIFMPPFSCYITYGGSTYITPIAGHKWEIDFNRKSCGQDRGDPVYAVAPGLVTGVDSASAPGRVIITHKGGIYSLYGHMINIRVKNNDRVKLRQKIGEIGDVGSPGQNHLHLGQYKDRWPNMIPIKFDGKQHPASVPNTRDIGTCPGVGFVNCKVLY